MTYTEYVMMYTEYVMNLLTRHERGMPIYSDEITDAVADEFKLNRKQAAAATAVAIKRIMDRSELPDLRCYQKGIYYRTAMTPFGELGINREALVAHKYLSSDNGYESGLRLLHYMGLTTQMPAEHLVVTNAAKDCLRYDHRLGVSICPPKTPITAENKASLQILDVLNLLDKAPVDVQDPYAIVAEHIRKTHLQYERLLYYAERLCMEKN